MEKIGQIGEKEVWLEILNRPYDLQVPFSGQDYVCILFANDPTITQDEQNFISDQIVLSGCMFAVCAGIDCSIWDDAIDWAELARYNYKVPDDGGVFTSWHEDDPTSEVIWFGLHATWHNGGINYTNYLVLLIGAHDLLEQEIRQLICDEVNGISHYE